MSYNTELNSNNTELQEILDTINELPDVSSIPGENGATFTPSVSSDGVLSWTNDKGLENPAPVNIKGKDGETPVKGTDYFTSADKTEMVNAVIAALPKYNGEVIEI